MGDAIGEEQPWEGDVLLVGGLCTAKDELPARKGSAKRVAQTRGSLGCAGGGVGELGCAMVAWACCRVAQPEVGGHCGKREGVDLGLY